MNRRRVRFTIGVALSFVIAPGAVAHPFEITGVDLVIKTDGTVEAVVDFHVDAMLADMPSTLPTGEAYETLLVRLAEIPESDLSEAQYESLRSMDAEEREKKLNFIRDWLNIRALLKFDAEKVKQEVDFPALENGDLPGQTFRIRAAIPEGAASLAFTASPRFNIVQLEIRREGSDEILREDILNPGMECDPFPLDMPVPIRSRMAVARQYLALGFEHILPKGLDHILFVLGLFLLSAKMSPLLWQVTAFTAAHTITLALSMYGMISLSPGIVEPLIALSIAYVAIENLFTSKLHFWRPAVVFGFGLLHGLGFAGVLGGLGMPSGRFATGLIGFNVGVELGQLAVIALAFACVGWARKREWYRSRIVIPASAGIALVACYWTIERAIG